MKKNNLRQYKTWIFDCDGVILNSNIIKTKAFYDVVRRYGEGPALKFKEYHLLNGGLSRYEKFIFFFEKILNREPYDHEMDNLVSDFSKETRCQLFDCEVAQGLEDLRKKSLHVNWMVVSSSDQNELRDIFYHKDIYKYFNSGVFGGPEDKKTIINRERELGNIDDNSVLFGDSIYDYEVATNEKIDFVFLYKWTEVKKWNNLFIGNAYQDIKSLI
jgi:phosphoglycolate phosphatase-like HAD superfamily hydrolase